MAQHITTGLLRFAKILITVTIFVLGWISFGAEPSGEPGVIYEKIGVSEHVPGFKE